MPFDLSKSRALQQRAERVIPGGVDSPARAFKSVGGDPPIIVRGAGSRMWDADGNEYMDYVGSWGPLILGHAHPEIVAAIERATRDGASFGASTPSEAELAEMVVEAMPSVEMVRFVSSGTEATMSAIRLARGFTKRDRVIKFEGCYHGHADSLLVKGGSGLATLGIPDSAGVPAQLAQLTTALPYNDRSALHETFRFFKNEIACVIVEPVVGNMGCVPPEHGYLEFLREITLQHGTVLIFDEVMTGFRLAYGGAQELFGIEPDLTTMGKIIGGGLPVGAYGGRRDIMNMVSPLGPVYQAGTLSGNPLAMAAGIATLKVLREKKKEIYPHLETLAEKLVSGILDAAMKAGVEMTANRVGSMFTWFFGHVTVKDWSTASKADAKRFGRFHRAMLESGIYLPPSQFEAAFLSIAHSDADIAATVQAAGSALAE